MLQVAGVLAVIAGQATFRAVLDPSFFPPLYRRPTFARARSCRPASSFRSAAENAVLGLLELAGDGCQRNRVATAREPRLPPPRRLAAAGQLSAAASLLATARTPPSGARGATDFLRGVGPRSTRGPADASGKARGGVHDKVARHLRPRTPLPRAGLQRAGVPSARRLTGIRPHAKSAEQAGKRAPASHRERNKRKRGWDCVKQIIPMPTTHTAVTASARGGSGTKRCLPVSGPLL